jgi:hypothetical protein
MSAAYSDRAAIRCRFYGPTDHRWQRVGVSRIDGNRNDPNRIVVDWDSSVGLTDNYVAAVDEYLRRAGWLGTWAVSVCNDGAVAVFVPGSDGRVA